MKHNTLESIAKQWIEISNKELTESYNNAKIVNLDDIKDINILKQSKEHIFFMMDKKIKNPSKIDLLIEEFRQFKTEMKEFKTGVTTRLDKIETRLDNLVVKNNLIETRLDNLVKKNNLIETRLDNLVKKNNLLE